MYVSNQLKIGSRTDYIDNEGKKWSARLELECKNVVSAEHEAM